MKCVVFDTSTPERNAERSDDMAFRSRPHQIIRLIHATRGRRSFLVGALALALSLVGSASDAIAETSVVQSTQINALASASWCESGNAGEICNEATLEVINPDKFGGVAVCLSVFGTGPDGETFEEGCADAAGTFALDPKDLSTASLAPTEIDLLIDVCDPVTKECKTEVSRAVMLSAIWTATGRLQQVTDRLEDAQNNCVTHVKIKGNIQAAVTTLTIDGNSTEGSGELQVLDVQDRTFCT
jgi:hypothetical protein